MYHWCPELEVEKKPLTFNDGTPHSKTIIKFRNFGNISLFFVAAVANFISNIYDKLRQKTSP